MLAVYAIASTSLVTRSLLRSSNDRVDLGGAQVMNFEETDDGADTEETDDEADQLAETLDTSFVCDGEHTPDYLPPNHVVRRSLHGVIIGTMKGGTQALHKILLTHPKILSSSTGHGELHFFNRYYQKLFSQQAHDVIPRQKTRQAFLKTLKDRKAIRKRNNGREDITNNKNKNKVAFHSAPLYLFSGRKVPARMFCTAPWVKVIAILRNPVERAFSHYHFVYPSSRKRDYTPSFDEFITSDISLLKKAGVLRDWNSASFESFAGSDEEFRAWEQYLTWAKSQGPVGRGMYSIQLEIWMDEFKKYNKSIDDDLLVLQSESSKEYPQESYHQAVQFLGLEPRTIRKHKHVLAKDHHATDYSGSDGMSNTTRDMLYKLFEPYNKRLYNLLGKDEWVGVWDDSKEENAFTRNATKSNNTKIS
eukprot:CCRYP_009541-RA/>CCRYP_009541-RA protein AED:0.26 eAED:0.26 QI:0/-1/0/1/-1/1/1/0/418